MVGTDSHIGYLLCKGKCLNCNVKTPIVYPLSELCCSLTCVIIFWKIQDFQTSLILCSIFLCLFFLSFIDIREQWLPACVTIPLFCQGLSFLILLNQNQRFLVPVQDFLSCINENCKSYEKR